MTATISRAEAIAQRFAAHGIGAEAGSIPVTKIAILDYGVQDTGTGGASWALANRGAKPGVVDQVAHVWSIRGAPHAYRRRDLGAVATATAPFSEADASKRIFDASSPLNKAGIPILEALDEVAHAMRTIVSRPTVKGELSGALTAALGDPFVRFCTVCDATHVYEQPFRLAALQAGLELEPGTSPPVLRRIPGLEPAFFGRLGADAKPRFDVIRNHLRFFGPASIKDAAAYLDATRKDVEANWPDDAVEAPISGRPTTKAATTYLLEDETGAPPAGSGGGRGARVLRLLGPYDPYLALRDRELLVADAAHRKDLWRTIGRPGAIVLDGEIIGTWRPKSAKGPKGARGTLALTIDLWTTGTGPVRRLVEEQAERFADHRDLTLDRVVDA